MVKYNWKTMKKTRFSPQTTPSVSVAYINLYLHNPHQASASYPFSNIDASINADADARCGQGFNLLVSTPKRKKLIDLIYSHGSIFLPFNSNTYLYIKDSSLRFLSPSDYYQHCNKKWRGNEHIYILESDKATLGRNGQVNYRTCDSPHLIHQQ